MKLKYYLKGFGVGVLFATILLSISLILNRQQTRITDEQIIARARELGMEMVSTEKESDTEEPTTKAPETSTAPTRDTAPDVTEKDTADQKETDADTKGMGSSETTDGMVQSGDKNESGEENPTVRIEEGADETTVVIHIERGMSSDTIVRLLEDAGVVESSEELLERLWEIEKTRYVRAGTYEFTRGMSVEEIADRISLD